MSNIIFSGKSHEDLFYSLFKKMKQHDCYHGAVAYLLSLDTVLKDHINSVFDFKEDIIKPECIAEPWQTGTSRKTTRLLFNLWNGKYQDSKRRYYYDNEDTEEFDEDEEQQRIRQSSVYYTPEQIFSCLYAPYYIQAIQLRFPENF